MLATFLSVLFCLLSLLISERIPGLIWFGSLWGYPAVGTIHGASGVYMRCMRRYGSVWLVVSDQSSLS